MKASIRNPVLAGLITVSVGLMFFVEKEEGFGPKNTQGLYIAYADPSDATGWKLPTICNGHTRGVYKGMTATLEQCKTWLKEDLEIAAKDVQRCVTAPLTQGQYDALVSFNYNLGILCKTQMVRYINNGQCLLAANEFNNSLMLNKDGSVKLYNGEPVMKFTTGGGIPLRGLVSRRTKERAMFEKDC
jgi:GH24 family phage-related lysozyme (muramidase)